GSLARRRGHIFEELQQRGTPLFNVKAYLPVHDSFGFTAELRTSTAGTAFAHLVFNHWSNMEGGSVYEPDSVPRKVVTEIRRFKGLNVELPDFRNYCDM